MRAGNPPLSWGQASAMVSLGGPRCCRPPSVVDLLLLLLLFVKYYDAASIILFGVI